MTTIHFCWSHLLIGLSTDVDISARIFILFNCPAQGSVRDFFYSDPLRDQGGGQRRGWAAQLRVGVPPAVPEPRLQLLHQEPGVLRHPGGGGQGHGDQVSVMIYINRRRKQQHIYLYFRSSLSSNSEGDETDLCRGYGRVSSYSGPGMMAASPYMVTRDTGQGHHGGHHDTGLASPGPGVKKDDKYWERRRWVNTGNIGGKLKEKNIAEKIILPPKSRVTPDGSGKINFDCECCALKMPIGCWESRWTGKMWSSSNLGIFPFLVSGPIEETFHWFDLSRERLSKYETVPQPQQMPEQHNMSLANNQMWTTTTWCVLTNSEQRKARTFNSEAEYQSSCWRPEQRKNVL